MKIKTKKEVTEVKLTLSIEEARELYLMCIHIGGVTFPYAYIYELESKGLVPEDCEEFLKKHYPQYIDKPPKELQF